MIAIKIDPSKLKAIVETAKSIARGLWFGILGLVVAALAALATSGAVTDFTVNVGGLEMNASIVIVAIFGFLAKSIDTYIHKNDSIDSNGIAPSFLQK